jgi:Holliday junction DNA helicase RuvA
MIGYIEGIILYKEDRGLIVNVGGVGYLVAVTNQVSLSVEIGERHRFWTHLVVREDALDLYAFTERRELEFFRLLIGVSGIGPKSALNVLSLADVDTLLHAIEGGDGAYLTKVSGIGKKLGEKIVLELKDKIETIPHARSSATSAESEALEALEALGYAAKDVRDVVRASAKEGLSTEEIIRKTLQVLGSR